MKRPKKGIAAAKLLIEPESDEQFAFIAGYTEGGLPYGITWEELGEGGGLEKRADIVAARPIPGAAMKGDNRSCRAWAPDLDKWPKSWMRAPKDLVCGQQLLPYFEGFLQALYEQGLARKTFVQYRDSLWLLGGTIISKRSFHEEYLIDPLATLIEAVGGDGILPDDYDRMSETEVQAFSRMCRRIEKYLRQQSELFD